MLRKIAAASFAMEEMAYSEYELQLKPGARLFLYTDGLPEAMDADKKMFGMDRTLIELNKLRDVSDEEVLDGMKKAVAGFFERLITPSGSS